jgi:4a-hydroxytetrahydrobiopterin dehydratase
VQVVLSTHAIKGLSMFDMVMAAKIDQLPVTYSPKWERENAAKLGQPQQPAGA